MVAYERATVVGAEPVKTIRQLREEKGWTHLQLANMIGASPSSIYVWESGRKEPRVSHLRALADAFGVRMDEIELVDIDHPRSDSTAA